MQKETTHKCVPNWSAAYAGVRHTSMIRVLWSIIIVTFLLSIFNWYEEGYFIGLLFTNLAAVFSGVISTLLFMLSIRRQWACRKTFKIVALLSVLFGFAGYLFYAINGQAENSSTSAAQMHVIVFPILHAMVTAFLFLSAMIVTFALKVFGSKYA
jgi:hypothetical protein